MTQGGGIQPVGAVSPARSSIFGEKLKANVMTENAIAKEIVDAAYRIHTLKRSLHGMVFGMATTKITITLDDDQVEGIRALVANGQAASVSGFVKHAVGVALFDAAGWKELLQEALQVTGGPLTPKERAWADSILSAQRGKRQTRKGKAA